MRENTQPLYKAVLTLLSHFLCFYSEIVINSQEDTQIVERSCVSSPHFLPTRTCYLTIELYQDRKIDIDTMCLHHFITCSPCGRCITCVDSHNYCHIQDTKQSHHHKDVMLGFMVTYLSLLSLISNAQQPLITSPSLYFCHFDLLSRFYL